MTGQLKTLLAERAHDTDHLGIDLDRIVSDGSTRVRRRRTAGLAAGAVGVAAVALVATQLAPDRSELKPADGTADHPHVLVYAQDHRLVTPDGIVSLDHQVRSFVQTDSGYVYAGPDRQVYSVLDGQERALGPLTPNHRDEAELVEDGDRVAWTTGRDGFTVFDQTTGARVSGTVPTNGELAQVTALDGNHVYVTAGDQEAADGDQAYAVDLTTLEPTPLPDVSRVVDAESGVLVVDEAGADGVVRNSIRRPGEAPIPVTVDGFANLSPDGTHLLSETNDEGILWDARTGKRLPFAADYPWYLGIRWLDDDRFTAMAVPNEAEEASVELLGCRVSTGACDPEVVKVGRIGEFQLDLGVYFSG